VIKTLAFIKRLPGTSRDAFREHYESVHVPLALPLLDGLERYVRYHIQSNRFGDCAFDVLTAFWYRDRAAADSVFSRLASAEGEAILADELTFIDKPANRCFAVSERSWLTGEEGEEHLFVLIARPEGMSRFDASSNLANHHWPRLLDRFDDPRFALLRDGFPMQGDVAVFDSVMQVRASGYAGLEEWSKSLESEDYRVYAVETRRFESDLDA
jgi:uncharacterized protein (TIGR02118 family)